MSPMHILRHMRAFLTLPLDIGSLLPIAGTAAGAFFGGPAGAAIGGSLGSAAKGIIGGQQGGSKSPNTYVPTGLGTADTTWQSALQQLMQQIQGAGGQITPEIAQAFTALLGIDRSGIGPAGAQAGQQYGQLAGQAGQAGNFLNNMGQGVGQAGQQLWQTAQDPQNALRNQVQQQVVDASRAGTSARGIGMGGEAAGIENKAVNDFLLNWQNNQLQRQATGLSGYANASNQAGRDVAGGLAAGALAPEYTQQSAMAPFNANVSAAGFPLQASQMYTGAMGGLNQQYGGLLSAIIPYLNSGQGATGQAFDQGQTGMANLTYGAGKLFGSGSAGGAGDWLSNIFSQPSAGTGSSDASWGGASNEYFPYGGGV